MIDTRNRDAVCVHCGNAGESGTVDELGATFCETCADAAVYGARCANCGRVPSGRPCEREE